MKKIMILNGPNMNMLGIREKNVYGDASYAKLVDYVKEEALKRAVEADCRQSNHEGDLIDWLQEAYFSGYAGAVINPGGYTHTSVALLDAVKAVRPLPVVEVHISDIDARESFRSHSYSALACLAQIKGKGIEGYVEAIDMILAVSKTE